MDRLELQILHNEMLNDCRVAVEAFRKAEERFQRGDQFAYEACGHQLSQMYNVIEQMGLRVAKAFENNIDDDKGWHGALLNRLSISIDGVRPSLIPHELKMGLNELKGFRHVFVHAYDLQLDPEKLGLLLKYGGQISDRLLGMVNDFIGKVEKEIAG